MSYSVEWDPVKAAQNLQKHGVSFEEAASILNDPLSITIDDVRHSDDEQRYVDIGLSTRGRLLVVVYTERDDVARIISCREATACAANCIG